MAIDSFSRQPKQTTIPSSRLNRTNSGELQTHLNFRRENQATKGKRWDRTAYAETGRRVSAGKGKAKGKVVRGWDDDEELELEEDDLDEPLAPNLKPFVDPGG